MSRLTLAELSQRIAAIMGDQPSKGTLSAIENGHRGVSADLLRAMEVVYGLEPGSIDTNYQPRIRPVADGEVTQ